MTNDNVSCIYTQLSEKLNEGRRAFVLYAKPRSGATRDLIRAVHKLGGLTNFPDVDKGQSLYQIIREGRLTQDQNTKYDFMAFELAPFTQRDGTCYQMALEITEAELKALGDKKLAVVMIVNAIETDKPTVRTL